MDMTGAIMTTAGQDVEAFRRDLLQWYDRHRRILPWRAAPGERPDPYRVWLSEIMLQQTTVQAVIPYFIKFLNKWPGVYDLAAAPAEEVMQAWAGLGYYARARNLHKCAQAVAREHNGVFPDTQKGLKALPGIGDYTCEAIAAIAFSRPANVVDGNVERVMARIHAVEQPLPAAKTLLKSLARAMAEGKDRRPGDYAQALMDLGATVCTPASPKCMICPVRPYCEAFRLGIAPELPRRQPKSAKPQKHGYVYWITDDAGRILFERREEKGMLGGTIGLPTSAWLDTAIEKTHLGFTVGCSESRVKIRHGFTHFDLELTCRVLKMGRADTALPESYFWVEAGEAAKMGIPTLFKKALKQFI